MIARCGAPRTISLSVSTSMRCCSTAATTLATCWLRLKRAPRPRFRRPPAAGIYGRGFTEKGACDTRASEVQAGMNIFMVIGILIQLANGVHVLRIRTGSRLTIWPSA